MRSSQPLRALIAALALGAASAAATPYLTVRTSASVGDGYYQTGYDADEIIKATSGPVTTSSSAAYAGAAWGGGTINSMSDAMARADYGLLGVKGSNKGVGGGIAGAVFSDDWIISNPALTGMPADLFVTVKVEGPFGGNASAAILLGEECLASGGGCRIIVNPASTLTEGTFGFPIHFKFGTPLNIILNLGGEAHAGGLVGSSFDLGSTAWISGLEVRRVASDGGGVVAEYTLSAASGHDYGFGSAPSRVPEPATSALAALAIGAIAVLRRRNATLPERGGVAR